MKNVLLITSSPRGEASHSTQVATELARDLGGNLTVRELWRDPLPALTTDFIHAIYTPEENRTPELRAALQRSDELIAELQSADVVVIAAGMINFSVPGALKNWIDHVTRSGLTFKYGESGPEGLLKGKRTILVLAKGGVYSSGPLVAMDHFEPMLHTNLGFIGLTNPEVVRIEGVAFGPDSVEQALREAREKSRELVAHAG